MRTKEKLSIYGVNRLYLLLSIIFLTIGGTVQVLNLPLGIIVTEILIVALPSIWFVKRRQMSLRKVFRFNKLGLKNVILIFFITILVYPIAVFFQAIFVTILSYFMSINLDGLPMEISQMSFLWSIVLVAILPGICEEIMFRGTMIRAYEKIGVKKSIIITSILFGMFHFTLTNFVGPIILGIVFGIMVYKTNSIYSSMMGHALNNSIALILNFFISRNVNYLNDMENQDVDLNTLETIIFFAVLGIIIIILIKIVRSLLNELTPSNGKHLEKTDVIDSGSNYYEDESAEDLGYNYKINLFNYIPIIIVTLMFFIFNIITLFK